MMIHYVVWGIVAACIFVWGAVFGQWHTQRDARRRENELLDGVYWEGVYDGIHTSEACSVDRPETAKEKA